MSEVKATKFGAIARGLQLKFKGDKRVWYVGENRGTYTFSIDGNTKVTRDNVPFNETVYVNVSNNRITSFDE